MSPLPGVPELRPDSPGVRVHLADLRVGDVIDKWHKRSGGFFVQEGLTVKELREDGTVLVGNGIVLLRDTGWGELRRK